MADFTSLLRDIRRLCPDTEVLENEPMARHCSFRIGGPAALLLAPASAGALADLCRFLRDRGEKPFLLGNGTNLLFPDEGLRRVVVKTCPGAAAVTVEGSEAVEKSYPDFWAEFRRLGGHYEQYLR